MICFITYFSFTILFFFWTDVVVDVKLTTTGVKWWITEDISWSLGSCLSNRGNPGQSDYQGNQEYNQQCHFSTSPTTWVFRLTCKETNDGDGWGGAFITINGINYCEEFLTGYEKIVYIEANPSKYLNCLFQVLFVSMIIPYLCKIIAIY